MSDVNATVFVLLKLLGTVGAFGMSILSFLGLYDQKRKIFTDQTAKNLSPSMFATLAAVFFTGALFALECEKPLMFLANLARLPLALLIVAGILRYESVGKRFYLLVVGLCGLSCVSIASDALWRERISLISGVIAMLFAVEQIWSIVREKNAGELSFALTISQFLGSVFWMLYLLDKSRYVVACCTLNVMIASTMVGVSWCYRVHRQSTLRGELRAALVALALPFVEIFRWAHRKIRTTALCR